MGLDSPVVIIYDGSGNPLAVQNGVATPASTPGLMAMGSDGTNSRYLLVDSSGRPVMAGAGVAGTPAGGVLSVQGVSGGTGLPVSGTVTANQGTAAALASAWPAKITDGTNTMPTMDAVGRPGFQKITDGTNTMPTADAAARALFEKITDGSNTAAVKAASTAAVAADPALVVAVSPNNTVGVTGTVTANVGTTGGLALDATLTGGTARAKITDGTNNAAVKAASTAAVAADPAVVVAISPNNTVAVSGTVTATNPSVGTSGSAVPASSTQIGGSDGTNLQAERIFDLDTGAGTEFNLGVSVRLPGSGGSVAGGTATNPLRTDPTGTTTQPISAASLPLPTGAATETTLAARLADTTFTARINTLGQKTMANSTPVVLASDQASIPVTVANSSTATRTDVASSATNVTLLALNASRKGATIYNDSTKILYVKFGTTATTSDFTIKMNSGDYYEVPFGYTGRIDGIWNSANGSARMTELT